MTKLIKLNDGLEVEIEIDENQAYEISDNGVVNSSIDQIKGLLKKVIQPFSDTYKELNKEMYIDSAEITIGIKIGVEGNFILAKSSGEANIEVKMSMRPKP